MGSKEFPKTAALPALPGAIERVQAEIRTVLANRAEVEAALQCHPHDTDPAVVDRWHGLLDELRDLQWLLARLGGGTDTDYYHRRRERGSSVTVRDGQHPVVEDRR